MCVRRFVKSKKCMLMRRVEERTVIVVLCVLWVVVVLTKKMLTTASKNRTRLHLYITYALCQTAFSMILPLVTYINKALHANSLQISLAFSGYYFTMLFSTIPNCVLSFS